MAVRNFYIRADIDGRQTDLTGGPRARDGGFTMTIYQRHERAILRAFTLRGYAYPDGRLHLWLNGPEAVGYYDDRRPEGVTIREDRAGAVCIETRRG